MRITINGMEAIPKKGTSLEIVLENPMFSGADGYSFNISFPLDCPQNRAIFGFIGRLDAQIEDLEPRPRCEIQAPPASFSGALKITGVSETEVTGQFLSGRSIANASKVWDSTYVNSINLGAFPSGKPATPAEARTVTTSGGRRFTALPWVASSTAEEQNACKYEIPSPEDFILASGLGFGESDRPKYHVSDDSKWEDGVEGVSRQIYLLSLVESICSAVGYTLDVQTLKTRCPKADQLLVCNALPASWGDLSIAHILPHWTVAEFFEKLGLLFGGDFKVDHELRHIGFESHAAVAEALPEEPVETVVDEHSVEIDDGEKQCPYLYSKNIRYKECDHQMQPYYSNPGAVAGDSFFPKKEFTTATALWNYQTLHAGIRAVTAMDKAGLHPEINHAADEDIWYGLRAVYRTTFYSIREEICRSVIFRDLTSVNELGPEGADDGSGSSVEIEFVPVCVDYTVGLMRRMFLPISMDKDDGREEEQDPAGEDVLSTVPLKTRFQMLAEADEKGGVPEYYDRIYIGFWAGNGTMVPGSFPAVVSRLIDWRGDEPEWMATGYSLSLTEDSSIRKVSAMPRIRTGIKYSFRFLSDRIPDPRSVFLIHGKRYLCEKLKATFSERGMSRLIEGEFYQVT